MPVRKTAIQVKDFVYSTKWSMHFSVHISALSETFSLPLQVITLAN